MALNFTSVHKATEMHGAKILVHGGSGNGKTSLCATAPNPVIVSAESGLLSLRKENLIRMYGADSPYVRDIPVIEIKNYQDLNDAYKWFASSAEAKNFQTGCLDSISEIAEVLLAAAKAVVKDPRQAYGEVIEKTLLLTRSFRDLPNFNIVIASKQESIKDEITGGMKFGPSLPGTKLGNQLPYYFDEVFHLGIGKDQATGKPFRYLQTQPDIQYVAKDRSGALAAYERPDLTAVINKILGGAAQ